MTYREGWGVSITPIWGYSEPPADVAAELPENWQENCEPDVITEIIIDVVRLAPTSEKIVGTAVCVELPNANCFTSMSNFKPLEDLWQDDTHDLRDRWFATEKEAREHAEYTEKRWKNPQPWESFVGL